nr:Protein of unknown function (DUF3154) [uncultured Mediterranean phage uvMED]BAR29878.1 Protein of unknown function (DUF3154) [uncultured Mediterranean phage uvMED]BAR29927.1 Protein of unknown function (DUF3154) [uncultured Mediterranean phage uvMED]
MLQAILGPVMKVASNYMETRKVKVEQKLKIEEAQVKAQIKRLETASQNVQDYDLEALRQTRYSYKDEVAMLVVISPFIGSFLPWTQEYVLRGWQYLDQAPSYYGPLFCACIAASMGIRWAVSAFGKKK